MSTGLKRLNGEFLTRGGGPLEGPLRPFDVNGSGQRVVIGAFTVVKLTVAKVVVIGYLPRSARSSLLRERCRLRQLLALSSREC